MYLEQISAGFLVLWLFGYFAFPTIVGHHGLGTSDGIAKYARSLSCLGQFGTVVLVILFLPSIFIVCLVYFGIVLLDAISVGWYKKSK